MIKYNNVCTYLTHCSLHEKTLSALSVHYLKLSQRAVQEVKTMSKSTTHLLKQLRSLMRDNKYVEEPLNAYIVPTSDSHESEYVDSCDGRREFITGFKGSYGTAVVTEKDALLWTDGRYYLQATNEMDENWTLMKEGVPDVPDIDNWLRKNLSKGSKVGVDPNVYNLRLYTTLHRSLESFGHTLLPVKSNLVDVIWVDRPARPANPVNPLTLNYTGKPIKEKFIEVNEKMKDKGAKHLVVTALDEVAYFLNLRGSDIPYNPVFFAYLIISTDSITVFMNPIQVTDEVKIHLTSEFGTNYTIKNYDDIQDSIQSLASQENGGFIWFSEFTNYGLVSLVPKKNRLVTTITPICLMKAIKNPVEANGMRNAHIKDAAALCCYFSWLEKNVSSSNITEISGAQKLEEFRKMQKDYVGNSFPTISSVGPHIATIHYHPNETTDCRIVPDQFYLCDSGGHYKDGTTDVTRTLHFGTPSKVQKELYTRVLKGQLKLGSAIFPKKILGNHLDSFAREFLWEIGLDYNHGTSHGIGSYLNVHEGPIMITWRPIPEDPGLEAGMFISNEPGYYQDGEFGMRIEDIVEIVEANTPHNFDGRGYLTFDTVTLVPKMKKLIVFDMLTDQEIALLNKYHETCRKVVGSLLDELGQPEAKKWLIRETEPIKR